jgi:hypothetical protein
MQQHGANSETQVLQSVTDHVLNKLPPWGRGGFSPGDIGSYTRRDFCSFIHSGCCFQYKKWDPGVWISVAEATDIGTIEARDT